MRYLTNAYRLTDGVLTVPEGTQYIRAQEFSGREDIVKLIVPAGVGFMEEECFAECPALEEVTLPEGLIGIGGAAFAECPALRRVNIPSTVTEIDTGAFFACESLREVSLPAGLEAIGEYAFQGSGLRRISVPERVRIIDNCAFFSCEELRRADVLGKNTKIAEDAFGSDYALVEGFIAPGYPATMNRAEELLYTLLWCSCPERHSAAVSARAESFIRANQMLMMERILKANNIPAMTGLAARGLLDAAILDESLKQTLSSGQNELTALLLKAKNAAGNEEGEFEL